jgi:hypothetical protein
MSTAMIEKLQTYLEERWIRKLLKRSMAENSSSQLSLDEIREEYVKGKKGQKKLLVYCILLISRVNTATRPSKRLNMVLREYLEALELAIELKSLDQVILMQEQRIEDHITK